MAEHVGLVGDVGGTNARFALAGPDDGAPYVEQRTLACVDFETPEDAISAYLAELGAGAPERICIAAAGPVVDGGVRFTNNAWTLREDRLRRSFGCEAVRVANDFEAIAHALPLLCPGDQLPLGERSPALPPREGFRLAVVGPGTGLGAAALLGTGAGPDARVEAIVSEAGHAGFAPESPLQDALTRELRHRFGRISAERLVSGPGVENLYWALARINGREAEAADAATIFAAAEAGTDPLAGETVALFHELLGQVAGDFALATGATDGVFVAGGVAQRAPARLANSRFREGFENKGRHRALLEQVPTALITHPQPGLLGAVALLSQRTGEHA
jgi:glucokinase